MNLSNLFLRGASVLVATGFSSILLGQPVSVDPALPHYEARPFTVPPDSPYLKPDGSIFLAGAEEMVNGIGNLNALFIKTHPGTKFQTLMVGSSVGIPAILFHQVAFGVVDRELLPEEIVPFEYLYKRRPLAVRVGRGSYSKRGYTPTMLICVNRKNPIEKLTTDEVTRIFTSGGGTGDITNWGQVGLTGEWSRRQIRVIGVGQRTGEGVFMKVFKFGDNAFTDRYEGMKSPEIGARMAEDTAAIALVDRSYEIPPSVKVVAIGEKADGYFSAATYEDVVAGRYPYHSYTYFYVNHDPAKPLDPFVKEYLRMVLSKEGQEALTNEPNGFLPLSARDVEEQLRKLN